METLEYLVRLIYVQLSEGDFEPTYLIGYQDTIFTYSPCKAVELAIAQSECEYRFCKAEVYIPVVDYCIKFDLE